MMDIPNLEILQEQANKLNEEFDLDLRLNRYITSSPDLISFAQNESEGIDKDEDAARALFISDFIVTSSEIPPCSDEDRHKSIISSFSIGLTSRCNKTEKLTEIFYLAYKTAMMIRRQDLYMAERGLERNTGLIRLKDAYINPYLHLCAEILGPGKCGWELSLLTAALAKSFPDKEFEHYKDAPVFSEAEKLLQFTWRTIEKYRMKKHVEKDDIVVIPNVNETKSVLALSTKEPLIFRWNLSELDASTKRDGEITSFLNTFLLDQDKKQQLISYRGRISGLDERVIIVRDPISTSKPFLVMRTPVNEINVTKTLNILHMRGMESGAWKNLEIYVDEGKFKVDPVAEINLDDIPEVKVEYKEEPVGISQPVEVEKEEPVKLTPVPVKPDDKEVLKAEIEALKESQPEIDTKEETVGVKETVAPPVKKKGFFRRLFSRGKPEMSAAEAAAKEKLEREKKAKQKAEKERKAREKAEKEKLEREKKEREKAEKERKAREKTEKDRLENRRKAEEKAERERNRLLQEARKKEQDRFEKQKKEMEQAKGKFLEETRQSSFPLSHSITVDAVSDLDLFQQFDTFRESDYITQGIFETDFETLQTVFFADKTLEDPTALSSLLKDLEDRIGAVSRYFFRDIDVILPEELFFVSKDDKKLLVCLARSDERIIGVVAETFVKDISDWKWSKTKEEQVVKRRTLHMRTGQLLAARRHTRPLEQAIERIFSSYVDLESMEKIEKSLLS